MGGSHLRDESVVGGDALADGAVHAAVDERLAELAAER